ncbi:MAG: tetratricopeptide repeat protein [Nitrospira sp.]|nr:tetratricopeptide repeat protein [Nitrospira sp.]
MNQPLVKIETALLAGDWDRLGYEAGAWVRAIEEAGEKDPRPYFALNVTHLIRGEFADAWRVHAHALQEAADIDRVGDWLRTILKQHPDNAQMNLIQGMFLAQSGQSEQSVVFYKEAAKLAPQSAYPHYFLAQIHERADHLEMAIKEYREAVKLDPPSPPRAPTSASPIRNRVGLKWPSPNIVKSSS